MRIRSLKLTVSRVREKRLRVDGIQSTREELEVDGVQGTREELEVDGIQGTREKVAYSRRRFKNLRRAQS